MRRLAIIGLALAATACAGCATAVTGDPQNINGTRAQLVGTLETNATGPVEYWVEYGPTAAYGSATTHAFVSVPANQVIGVTPTITGLTRATTYHYRFCAQDGSQQGGPGCGEDKTFKTQPVDCGDTVTDDVKLIGTPGVIVCDRGPNSKGLVVGADGVEIDLGHHGFHGTGAIGIDNSAGHDDVTIREGGVSAWSTGVRLDNASRNWLLDFGTSDTPISIHGGDANTILNGNLNTAPSQLALSVVDSNGFVVDGSVGFGMWSIAGDGARIRHNDVGGISQPFCLKLQGNQNRVASNTFYSCAEGDIVLTGGSANVIADNEVYGFYNSGEHTAPGPTGDGIFVGAFTAGTVLRDNYAHENPGDGIEVQSSSASLQSNRADNNHDFGIDAASGVTDLGGNTATGNANPLQCRNVFCP